MAYPRKYATATAMQDHLRPDDWDAMVDAANGMTTGGATFAYPFTYIIRLNGGFYEAVNSAGVITYGGSGTAGGVDGTLASDVFQAAFDDVTTRSVYVRYASYPMLATLTPKSNLKVVCDPETTFVCNDVGLLSSTTYTANFLLENCNITNPTGAVDTAAKCLVLDMLQHSELKNVDIADNWDIGIEITNSLFGSCYNKLDNVRLHRSAYGGSYGIKMTPTAGTWEFDSTWNRVVVENYTVGNRIYGDRNLFLGCIVGNAVQHGTGWQVNGNGVNGGLDNTWINPLLENLTIGHLLDNSYYNTIIGRTFNAVTTPISNITDYGLVDFFHNTTTLPHLKLQGYLNQSATTHPVTTTWGDGEKGRTWWCVTHGVIEYWDGIQVRTTYDVTQDLPIGFTNWLTLNRINHPVTAAWGDAEKGRIWYCVTHDHMEFWNGLSVVTYHDDFWNNEDYHNTYCRVYRCAHPDTTGWGVPEQGRWWECTTHDKLEWWTGAAIETVSSA